MEAQERIRQPSIPRACSCPWLSPFALGNRLYPKFPRNFWNHICQLLYTCQYSARHIDAIPFQILYTPRMSDYMDRLPSREKERIRKKMRSPEAYERLREKVKGPEDLENEMEKSEKLAELHLAMESDSQTAEAVKATLEKDLSEKGIEAVLESDALSPEAKKQIEAGKFTVAVSSHPSTHEDALVVMAEGNIQEKIPVKVSFSEQYTGQFGSR